VAVERAVELRDEVKKLREGELGLGAGIILLRRTPTTVSGNPLILKRNFRRRGWLVLHERRDST
jgi:hypothetical protein